MYLKKKRSIDFTLYRQDTILRGIRIRLKALGFEDYSCYLDYLREHSEEIDALLQWLVINVSEFFRGSLTFAVLGEIVLPELYRRHAGEQVRVWSIGCGEGEEPYSVAILLKELMPKSMAFGPLIVATDVDLDALEKARKAEYAGKVLQEAKKMYLDKYFRQKGEKYVLLEEIRKMVHFVCHDITNGTIPREGVFTSYHLVLCRNVTIYLKREIAGRVFQSVSCSLSPGGYLVLGETEILPEDVAVEYQEVVSRSKVFQKMG